MALYKFCIVLLYCTVTSDPLTDCHLWLRDELWACRCECCCVVSLWWVGCSERGPTGAHGRGEHERFGPVVRQVVADLRGRATGPATLPRRRRPPGPGRHRPAVPGVRPRAPAPARRVLVGDGRRDEGTAGRETGDRGRDGRVQGDDGR